MKIILASILICMLFFITIIQSADAVHVHRLIPEPGTSKSCSVNVSGQSFPIHYNNNLRGNPDGSVYPGDAIHFLFHLSGSSTCTSFTVEQLISEGIFKVTSHKIISAKNSISGSHTIAESNINEHNHLDNTLVPKYLKTTHYYKKTVTDTIYHSSKGGGNSWYEEIFTLSEKPILSIREDQTPTKSQLKKINKYDSHYLRDDIITKETFAWGMTNTVDSHGHVSESDFPRNDGLTLHHFEHPLEDQSSADEFRSLVERSCSTLGRHEMCVFGHAEINLEQVKQKCLIQEMKKLGINTDYNSINDECINVNDILTQTARGSGLSCNDKKCKTFAVHDTANTGVSVLDSTPDVTFENPAILDTDRYDSKNIDGTYYTLDAPAILIKPEKKFRDIRNDTITFQVDRQNNPLHMIFADKCSNEHCVMIVKSQNTTDTIIEGINGDRLEVFMPQTLDKHGVHDFTYDVRMFNLGREIGYTVANTNLFIVDYTPKYSHNAFSYVMLKSDGKTSFEKQWGTAMQYYGSIGTGKDDDGLLHQDRRSKINDSIHSIIAIDVSKYDGLGDTFEQYPINATYHLNGGDDIADIVQSVSPSILTTLEKDSLGEYEKAMVSNNDTAVFTNAGFGRIKFAESDMQNSTISETSIQHTVHSTIQSVDFGGYDETEIMSYSYEYPSAYLAVILNVTAINSDGTINETLPIDAEFVIRETNGTKHLAQYMETFIKNFPDSEQGPICDNPRCHQQYTSSRIRNVLEQENRYGEEYADMYLGDMHDVGNTASGTGIIIQQINLPAVFIIPELWDVLSIKNSSDASFSRYGEINALSSPGIYDLVINSNERENAIAFPTFDFSRGINYTINVDDGNYLNHTRYLSSIYVSSPDEFGEIKYLQINDRDKITTCAYQCYLNIHKNSTVSAENVWGGTAQLFIVKQVLNGTGDQSEIVAAYIDNAGEAVLLLATIIVIVMLYIKYWR